MLKKILWLILLVLSLIMAIVGLLLPIMPSIPFLVITNMSLNHVCPSVWQKSKIYKLYAPMEQKIKNQLMKIMFIKKARAN